MTEVLALLAIPPSPLSQLTGPAISMLSCRACLPLSTGAKPAQPHHPPGFLQPQRQEGKKWNTKLPSSGVPCMFHLSSVSTSLLHLQPLPSRGRTDARPREVRLALALPERPPMLCPHVHLPDWGRCESNPRRQPHHQSAQSQDFSPSPALCQVQHAIPGPPVMSQHHQSAP